MRLNCAKLQSMDNIFNSKSHSNTIIAVGIATFFFGFGAGALLNLYLLAMKSPLVLHFRGSLTFISSIFGDGIILPIVNMLAISFLLENRKFVNKLTIILGLISGLLITIYFHVVQGIEKLVNWSMPTPWHWNLLGLWHAVYMFLVASLLSLYFIVSLKYIKRNEKINKEFVFIILGILIFFILLKFDYSFLDLKNILLNFSQTWVLRL